MCTGRLRIHAQEIGLWTLTKLSCVPRVFRKQPWFMRYYERASSGLWLPNFANLFGKGTGVLRKSWVGMIRCKNEYFCSTCKLYNGVIWLMMVMNYFRRYWVTYTWLKRINVVIDMRFTWSFFCQLSTLLFINFCQCFLFRLRVFCLTLKSMITNLHYSVVTERARGRKIYHLVRALNFKQRLERISS